MSRTLRSSLFAVVALVQLAVAGGAIVKSEIALRTGEPHRFRIEPVDPVDAFRGRYVAVRFALDHAPVADDFDVRAGAMVFVPVEIDADGYAAFGQAGMEPPTEGAYLRLRSGPVTVDDDGTRQVWVTMPFQRFYMDENVAQRAERAVWAGRGGRREAFVSVRIRGGIGVIEELYIDSTPISQWLAEHQER
jgi:uncharacterized membrane-anchored protein